MGYYTGSGVVVGGGTSESMKEQLFWVVDHVIYQKTVSKTTLKNGVSLATAQGEDGSMNMQNRKFSSGGSYIIVLSCEGTITSASYSRIGDSNLYALNLSENTVTARDSAGWTKGNV